MSDPRHILVAEDDLRNRELIREVLELKGFAVSEAADGQEALEMAQASAPDLLIIDIQMPRLGGYELLERLHSDERLRSVPVIALTALAMEKDIQKAKAGGFSGYVTKPFKMNLLYAEVERCLTLKKAVGM